MSKRPTLSQLRDATGISQSYASMILSGSRKSIPRSLAIHILRRTGWAHDVLTGLTDEQISTLEAVEPWTRPAEQGVAA